MTRTIILPTIVAVTLMTGLLVGSFPTTTAAGPSAPCPPVGQFVNIVIAGVDMGPFPIDSYSYSTASDRKNPKMFMFSFEPDAILSPKVLDAVENGTPVDIHFTSCKAIGDGTFKKHTVWLMGVAITETSESTGDDGFPTEKAKGTYEKVERETTTGPPEPPD